MNETTVKIERYYFKCTYCERPFSVDCDYTELREIKNAPCPLCSTEKDEDGQPVLRVMGRVEGTNLVKQGVKAACDLRCTSAVGPKCDCICCHKNHGTHRLVTYDKTVRKLSVVNKDLLNGNVEYLARIARLATTKKNIIRMIKAALDLKYADVIAIMNKRNSNTGEYVYLQGEDWNRYYTYKGVLNKINKIEDMLQVKRKITELAKLFAAVR